MCDLKVGDIVARKSYGGDIPFTIINIISDKREKPVYILRGLLHRIEADSHSDDLIKQNPRYAYLNKQRYFSKVKRQTLSRRFDRGLLPDYRLKGKPGTILHIDSSEDFLDKCLEYYSEAKLKPIGRLAPESEQPNMIRQLLEQYRPDIIVITGHDSLKKAGDKYNVNSYSNSGYYIQSVKEARRFEPGYDKLCIFAGACQSYYERIMDSGANFASSPGRILINALDPALVAEKIAITDSKMVVRPEEIAQITVSGPKGIGGINTRGRFLQAQ